MVLHVDRFAILTRERLIAFVDCRLAMPLADGRVALARDAASP